MALGPCAPDDLVQEDLVGIGVVGEPVVPRPHVAVSGVRRVLHDGGAARAPDAVSGRGQPVAEPRAVQERPVCGDTGADDRRAEFDGTPHDTQGDGWDWGTCQRCMEAGLGDSPSLGSLGL